MRALAVLCVQANNYIRLLQWHYSPNDNLTNCDCATAIRASLVASKVAEDKGERERERERVSFIGPALVPPSRVQYRVCHHCVCYFVLSLSQQHSVCICSLPSHWVRPSAHPFPFPSVRSAPLPPQLPAPVVLFLSLSVCQKCTQFSAEVS